MADDPRRRLPQVDRLVREVAPHAADMPRAVVVEVARGVLEHLRRDVSDDSAADLVRRELDRRRLRRLQQVINATGVVLHTNLGRAPLHPAAIEAVSAAASGYSNLEFDLSSGTRGSRHDHVEPLVALATGAQACVVVNNNAAGVLLVSAALAAGREVLVSRGELIEIGGSFRLPDVLSSSGAVLREVGTTNRTHLRDYDNAIGDGTAMLMKVHPSNYRVVGFTASPSTEELASLARSRGVPFVYDVGSGLLDGAFGGEPSVRDALAAGADLVCFSGDKLLGGPQAGIVCGRADLVARLRAHPLVRALRPDKMTLAALAATVSLYLDGSGGDLPVWRSLKASPDALRERCKRVAAALHAAGLRAEIGESASVAGGGSLPGLEIPTPVVEIFAASPDALAARARAADPPVVVRVADDRVLIDLRTVDPDDDDAVVRALAGGFARERA